MSELEETKEDMSGESGSGESQEDEQTSEEEEFPVLRLIRPGEAQLQAERSAAVLFRPPKPPRSRALASEVQRKARSRINKLRKKSLDDMFAEISSRRRKRNERRWRLEPRGSGSLTRSVSWDSLHRVNLLKETIPEERDTTDGEAKTFVYVPPSLAARENKRKARSVTPPPASVVKSNPAASSGEKAGPRDQPSSTSPKTPPPEKGEIAESTNANVGARRKRSKASEHILQGPVAPSITASTTVKALTDSELTATQTTQKKIETDCDMDASEGVGILRVKLLAVSIPRKPQPRRQGDPDDASGQSGDDACLATSPDKDETPKDGIFCVISINGRHFQTESSLQPLNTRKQLALWDSSEPESVFYVNPSQQLFMTCRKIPLDDISVKQNIALSRHPRADSVGVGILPISQLSQKSISAKDEWLENWTEIETKHYETTVILEPRGSVLLGLSYITFTPKTKVSCKGSVIVQSISGVDCSWNGDLCLIGCTLDIDSTNYGTTGNVLGLDDIIAEGWSEDFIDFQSDSNYLCRVNIWGFATDETEHCFGESCIPLAAILPFSKQIVHQQSEDGPLQLLEKYERQLTVPIEPKGLMKVQFSLSPLHSDAKELDCDGLILSTCQHNNSTKETFYHPDFEHSMEVPVTSLPVTNGMLPPTSPATSNTQSGTYDHLLPIGTGRSSSIRRVFSLPRAPSHSDSKFFTWRIIGSTKIQVPISYHEKTFRRLTETYNPVKEVELLKEQLRNVNGKLAESEFYREKAELQVKTLKDEVEKWKKKCKKKKRKK